MTRILILLTIFYFPFLVFGQEVEFSAWEGTEYGAAVAFPANGVADDFGPRRFRDNWHGGVDYNSNQDDGSNDKWNLIIAPEDGVIVNVNRLWTTMYDYKQICYEAGDHRYVFGHVYDESGASYIQNDSTIILTNMLGPDSLRWAQIIIWNGDTLVYGQVDGGEVAFNGDTLITTTTVVAGNALVPIGESSSVGAAHLHLNTIPANRNYSDGATTWNSNPLQYLDYEKADYDLNLYTEQNNQDFEIEYPGTSILPLALKVEMETTVSGSGNKRYDHIFDVEKVNFYIKECTSTEADTFKLIIGPAKESKIVFGGILGENKLNHPNPNFGNWERTGVDSRAYNSGSPNEPFDIYHYSDWLHRIHESDSMDGSMTSTQIADIPTDARYNDGKYEIYGGVNDIRDSLFSSDTTSFTLDNFKPYIQSVQIDYDNEITYESEWNSTDPSLTIVGDGYVSQGAALENPVDQVQPPFTTPGIVFTISSSEPLAALSMFIEDANFPSVDFGDYPGVATDNTSMEWEFIVPYDSLPYDHCFQLIFNGNDCSDNELLDLTRGANNTIPTRQSATTWSAGAPDGNDEVHEFCLRSCTNRALFSRVDCLNEEDIVVLVLPATSSSIEDGSIEIQIPSGVDTLSVTWTEMSTGLEVGDGTRRLTKRLPGIYCWEFNDPECCRIWSNCHEIRNCADNSQMTLEAESNCDLLTINLSVSGGIEPYDYVWRFGSDVTNPVVGTVQDLVALIPGEYCVEVADACGQSTSLCQEVGINIDQITSPEILDYCQGYNGFGSINLFLRGIPSPEYNFNWSNGDTTSAIYGLEPGQYCVTIINASNCSSSNCYSVLENEYIQYVSGNTCYGETTGWINLSVYSGAYIIWDNGMQGTMINNLNAGTYCYQWENQACGKISDCIEIEYKCCSEIVMNPNIIEPEGCDIGGSIGFGPAGSGIDGVIYPIDYLWSTGDTTSIIDSLGAGIFSLTVTDAIGCTATESWDLSFEGFVTLEVTSPACEGVANGVAVIVATNNGDVGNSDGNFNFAWSNGFTTNGGNESYQEDLMPGTYMVTVTDIEAQIPCNHITSLIVGEVPIEGPFEVEGLVTPTCPDQTNGRIDLQITGGNSPYSIIWSNGSWQSNNFSLSVGTYTVTVTDVCDRALISQFAVPGLEMPNIGLVNSSGCEGEGTAQFQVLYSGSYEVNWEHNGQTNLNLSGLSSGNYCVNVIGDNGCSARTCFDLGFGGGVVNIVGSESCEGFNDGVLQLEVYTSQIGEYVEIIMIDENDQATPLFLGVSDSNPMQISQGNLNPGVYELSVSTNCGVYNYEILIDEVSTTLVFLSFINNTCLYAKICGEQILGTEVRPAFFDWVNTNSNFGKCRVPIICHGSEGEVDEHKFPKRKMRAGFFLVMLNFILTDAIHLPQTPDIINQIISSRAEVRDAISSRRISACSFIVYCSADFKVLDFLVNLVSGRPISPVVENKAGCLEMRCGNGLFSFTTEECIEGADLGHDEIFFDITVPNLPPPINPRTTSIATLINLHLNGDLEANVTDYSSSQLRNQIVDYIIDGWTNLYYCAYITFNPVGGQILIDEFDNTVCGANVNIFPLGIDECTLYTSQISLPGIVGYVWCSRTCFNGEPCAVKSWIYDSWDAMSLMEDNPNSMVNTFHDQSDIFLLNPGYGDTLSGFFETYHLGDVEKDEHFYSVDFLSKNMIHHETNLALNSVTEGGFVKTSIVNNQISSVKYFKNEERTISILDEEIDQKKIRLESDKSLLLEFDLEAKLLDVIEFHRYNNKNYLLIGYTNFLKINDDVKISGIGDYQLSEIVFDDLGAILVNHVIEFDGTASNILFAEYNLGSLLISIDNQISGYTYLDSYNPFLQRSILSINHDLLQNNWSITTDYFLANSLVINAYRKLSYSPNDVIMLSGQGLIQNPNGSFFFTKNQLNYTNVISISSLTNDFETLRLDNLQLDYQSAKITDSKLGDIYVVFESNSDIDYSNESLDLIGNEDLILIKSDANLNGVLLKRYGASNFGFDIKKIKSDSIGIFIGGNILSSQGIVEIEDKNIYVLDDTGIHSFMIYLNLESPISSIEKSTVDKNGLDQQEDCNILAYFAGKDLIIQDAERIKTISLFDRLGRLVFTSNHIGQVQEIGNLVPGIYFLRLQDVRDNICTKKLSILN